MKRLKRLKREIAERSVLGKQCFKEILMNYFS